MGGGISVDVPATKILGRCEPGIPGGVDSSESASFFRIAYESNESLE